MRASSLRVIGRLLRSPSALASAGIVALYVAVAVSVAIGWIAAGWQDSVAPSFSPPSGEAFRLWLGSDMFGRSVMLKVLHGALSALSVGAVACLISVPLGVVLGLTAGYVGRWVDELILWLGTLISSVPQILLLMAIAFSLGKGFGAICMALGFTGWVGLARQVRAEVMKQREGEYVLAAAALGATHTRLVFKHLLPNVAHFAIINLSLQFIAAIKAEVILSFLGLGSAHGSGMGSRPSWGVMIDDAKLELVRGYWWQLAGAAGAMFVLILALNILGDALRDSVEGSG